MKPIDPALYRAIWDGMFTAEWLYRYYYLLFQRYTTRQKFVTFTTLVAGSSAVASLAKWVPDELLPVAAFVVVGLSIWSVVDRHADKAAMAAVIHQECAQLLGEFRALKDEVDAYELDHATARDKVDNLRSQLNAASGKSTSVGLVKYEKLANQAETDAKRELERFSNGTTTSPAPALPT